MPRKRRNRRRYIKILLYYIAAAAVLTFVLYRQIARPAAAPLIQGVYYAVETAERAVALTFNAVWEPGETLRILDVLDRYSTRGTFFLTGTWLRYQPHLAREIVLRGHEIGYHGYSQKALTGLALDELDKEFQLMEEALREELNLKTNLFRPPHGELDQALYHFARERGYKVVLWSVNPQDWLDPGADIIADQVLNNAGYGSIILFHTSSAQTVEALPLIIQSLRFRGYRVTNFSGLILPAGGQEAR